MRVLVTGAQGFIGKNLCVALAERGSIEVRHFTRDTPSDMLPSLLEGVDVVFHLAGVNRPQDPTEFQKGNAELTQLLCNAIRTSTHPVRVVYTSSSQTELDNPYGKSKKQAEQALLELERERPGSIFIARLPNVFGKWARPNYNSAVATFCHNITRDLPITIHDRHTEITLVYIDTVVRHFMAVLDGPVTAQHGYLDVQPQSRITVGALADLLTSFKHSRETLITERVGTGLTRELYSTYVSYLPTERFSYEVPKYGDPRGVFVEMLKTPDCGQFSYFTAHPGITRGGHYHHTKTEKFLVIKGQALFRFRQIDTGDYYELTTSDETPEIVETVPGWTHDITNTGDNEMIVMLWANEIFDRQHPDTITCPL
ncbi:MAG: UDP-2-acetamido-2,6-beta-L-arabino-hexul-4-ose reductase [Alcaligenes nematophilus]|uniref:UDP-2-acetamido-2,6-beta-L-arabino-hexul-4-ose reductase n=1 Tax=Alcaligenes nematophilus TaxID=2994643 RepID=UPI0007591801|nr:NAD-dependent epimerase/dehydratase family protein [Alcaligenes faecalis]KVX04954.1 capsular biosynthesis protein [Alcaligenes faecalis]